MKKNTIILVSSLAILFSLIFGYVNRYNHETDFSMSSDYSALASKTKANTIPDLYYGVDSRFAPITKTDVHSATTIYDFLNEGEKAQIDDINSVDLIIVKDNQLSTIHARGTTDQLTNKQLNILKSTDYFSHFTIRTEFRAKSCETGNFEDKFFGPHLTVVPEQQATYVDGKDALLNYLRAHSKESLTIVKDGKLGSIKFSFVIDKQGEVTNVKHDAMTTGYPSIDKNFIELLENIPGKWTPAKNANGEKIEQELVFTFGPRDRC